VCFTPEGEHLLIGGEDGTLRRWAFPAGEDVQRVQWKQSVTALAANARTGHIAVGLGQKPHPYRTSVLDPMRVVLLEPGGTTVELLSQDKSVGYWFLAFSPEGRDLAALNVDGHTTESAFFAVVEVSTGTLVQQRLEGTLCNEGSVSFSPDGHLAVAPDLWRTSGMVGAMHFTVFESSRSLAAPVVSGWEYEAVFLHDGRLVTLSWNTIFLRSHVRGRSIGPPSWPEERPGLKMLTAAASAPVLAMAAGHNRVLVGSVDELMRYSMGQTS
jgi:WD40 repeat protein